MPLFGKKHKKSNYNNSTPAQLPSQTTGAPPAYSEYPFNRQHRHQQQQQLVRQPDPIYPYQNAIQYQASASCMQLARPPQAQISQQSLQYPQNWLSYTNLPTNISRPLLPQPNGPFQTGADLYNKVGEKLYDIISLIDEEIFSGNEQDLIITLPQAPVYTYSEPVIRGGHTKKAIVWEDKTQSQIKSSPQEKSVNVFSKLDLYLNSRLPVSLPPLRLYTPTYTLLCLAAKYSESTYRYPQSAAEKKYFVSADDRLGTKAMVIKSVPSDDKKIITFAIRGTSMWSRRDWGVNLSTEPISPQGFLDDPGNLCHAGFLRVAKAMIRPIAMRLRELLQENPNRTTCSLLITGHSAGGAVASLLYSHMLSQTVQSDLNILTGCFKRIHCITFGAPPTSLLPLQKPRGQEERYRKWMFHSLMNEGDPVVRAEKAYVRSLVDLLASPVPSINTTNNPHAVKNSSTLKLSNLGASMSRLDLGHYSNNNPVKLNTTTQANKLLWWDVPPATLSNAGRLVVLRCENTGNTTTTATGKQKKNNNTKSKVKLACNSDGNTVTASIVTDEQLRQVIFGDPLMHSMELYRRRVEALAIQAITGEN